MMASNLPVTPAPAADIPQETRDLKRFNLWALYLPIAVAILLAIAVFIWLIIATLFPGTSELQTSAGGVSDFLLIVVLCPATLIWALLPAAGIFLLYKRQQGGSWIRKPLMKYSRIGSGGLTTVQQKVGEVQPKIAAPVIKLNSGLTFVGTLIKRFNSWLLGSS